MQMILAMVFLIYTFKYPNFAENMTNFAETPKIVGPLGTPEACFCQLQGLLALDEVRALSSAKGSDGQDCRGKFKGRGLVEHC